MIGVLLIVPFLVIIGLLFFAFWIIMLVDSITRKFKEDSEKIVWVLVVIFTGIIGALIYYFVVYSKHKSLRWFWNTLLIVVLILIVLAAIFYFSNRVI